MSRGMRGSRAVLALLGAACLAVGVVALLQKLAPGQLLGLGAWLACAVILHDAVLVPLLTLAGELTARAGRRLPRAVLTIARLGFLVGAILSATTVPELVAQRLGPRNPTVVPQNYAQNLALIWIGIALLVALSVSFMLWRARRTVVRRRSTSR